MTRFDNFVSTASLQDTRPISWLKGPRRDFDAFPAAVQLDVRRALTVAAEGGKADKAKPFKGVDGGVFEMALQHRGNAYRVLYAVRMDTDLWVIHAFQKKSRSGIKTPQNEVDLIQERLKRLKEVLR